ncbi:hypothetical protein D9M68_678860 [compost metagenome]|jgi:hypothetical protein|uniref:hypothetical protein n=1 Tax=Edaphocola flava TaxID=2499629 RepID=UPI000FA918A4|nr:hypothetical protein [Edaphocola flava]
MKRIASITAALAIFGGAIAFGTSCNKPKDWNCECTVNGNTSTSIIRDKTYKEAKAECNRSGSVLGVDYNCKITVF